MDVDHPFATRRAALADLDEALTLAADARTLLDLTDADRALVRARREACVADETARLVLARRALRIGLLLEDLAARKGMAVDELARWLAPNLD